MLFAITSRNTDGSEKKIIALQEGLSRKSVFDNLLPILDRVASRLKENPPYSKNWETWGIDTTLYSVEEVSKVETEDELVQLLLMTF